MKYYQLEKSCSYTSLNTSGELFYCYNRGHYKPNFVKKKYKKNILDFLGQIQCCFDKHSCVKDWEAMQLKVYTTAKYASLTKQVCHHFPQGLPKEPPRLPDP